MGCSRRTGRVPEIKKEGDVETKTQDIKSRRSRLRKRTATLQRTETAEANGKEKKKSKRTSKTGPDYRNVRRVTTYTQKESDESERGAQRLEGVEDQGTGIRCWGRFAT